MLPVALFNTSLFNYSHTSQLHIIFYNKKEHNLTLVIRSMTTGYCARNFAKFYTVNNPTLISLYFIKCVYEY
jgi:hypothetical protein